MLSISGEKRELLKRQRERCFDLNPSEKEFPYRSNPSPFLKLDKHAGENAVHTGSRQRKSVRTNTLNFKMELR